MGPALCAGPFVLRAGKVSIEPKMQACLQETAKCERAHDGAQGPGDLGYAPTETKCRRPTGTEWARCEASAARKRKKGVSRRSTFSRTTDISLSNYSGDIR